MMLVCDVPVAIDLAQANRQSEQKAVLVYRIAGRVRSAPQDGDREGDVSACGNGEFSKVEGRTRFVVTEKQIPGLTLASLPEVRGIILHANRQPGAKAPGKH